MGKRQLLTRILKPALFKYFLPNKPVSRQFGFDRGTPVDRFYIDRFMEENKEFIYGSVLESGDPGYTNRFGKNVTESLALLLHRSNTETEIEGDLACPETLPAEKFDCYICPQTLQYVDDVEKAVKSCWQVLKPGGVYLGSVPALSQQSVTGGDSWADQWRFNRYAMERIFAKVFGKENIKVQAYGNVKVAAAFLYGLSLQELSSSVLNKFDPEYECVVTIFARKANV